jgi:hypothetical protein
VTFYQYFLDHRCIYMCTQRRSRNVRLLLTGSVFSDAMRTNWLLASVDSVTEHINPRT